MMSATFIFWWAHSVRRQRGGKPHLNKSEPSADLTSARLAIGFVTNFLDRLGIGSFATTTSAFRLLRIVRDEYIPGTMIVGHTLPVIVQAFIFMTVVRINPAMLVLLIIASLIGGWLGAGIVSDLPRRWIQVGMGIALLLAALSMLMSQFGLFPSGGVGLELSAPRLLIAFVMNFIFGALVTLGIGNYAPSLVLFSLLGLDPRVAFPVMMGSGAFTGIVAGIRFLNKRRYDQKAALGLMIGGIPAVLLAAFAVKSLSLDAIRWLVMAVIVYTAVTMLRTAGAERQHRAGLGGGLLRTPWPGRDPQSLGNDAVIPGHPVGQDVIDARRFNSAGSAAE
jgi:uncharacterized membrane protein YfcA